MSEKNVERLQRSLHKVVTGAVSLNLRQKLAEGEAVTLKVVGAENYTVNVEEGIAKLRSGTQLMAEEPFVPWTEVDENYKAMTTEFGRKGEVDDERFIAVGDKFHERFDC